MAGDPMQAISKVVCLILAIWLCASAMLPLFGLNFIASKLVLVGFTPDEDTLFFVRYSFCGNEHLCVLPSEFSQAKAPALLIIPIAHFGRDALRVWFCVSPGF